jgi:hypothetical protein
MAMRLQQGLLGNLDPPSRERLRIFGLKLIVLLLFVGVFAVRYRYPPFGLVAEFAGWYGAFAGLLALVRSEPIGAPSLNGWDELLGFFALKFLAGFFAAVAG